MFDDIRQTKLYGVIRDISNMFFYVSGVICGTDTRYNRYSRLLNQIYMYTKKQVKLPNCFYVNIYKTIMKYTCTLICESNVKTSCISFLVIRDEQTTTFKTFL